MHHLSKTQTIASWLLQLLVAGILLQTLFFKFTAAEESVYIFTTVGQFVGIEGVETRFYRVTFDERVLR